MAQKIKMCTPRETHTRYVLMREMMVTNNELHYRTKAEQCEIINDNSRAGNDRRPSFFSNIICH